jgi:hypothetical protein
VNSVDALDRVADIVVVDLGVDASLVEAPGKAVDYGSAELPRGIDLVFAALERFIELERARLERGAYPRRVVLVNSATAFWDTYVLAQLDCSYTTVHSRVRRATVKLVPDEEVAAAAVELVRRQIRWSARRHRGDGRLHIPADARVEIGKLNDYSGFGDGWSSPDTAGIWTQGRRSELTVAFDGADGHGVLALAVDHICVEAESSVSVAALVDGERVATRDFTGRRLVLPSLGRPLPPRLVQAAKTVLPETVTERLYPFYRRLTTPAAPRAGVFGGNSLVWRIELPRDVLARRNAQLTLVVDEPRTPRALGWSDDERELGIHLRSVTLEHVSH